MQLLSLHSRAVCSCSLYICVVVAAAPAVGEDDDDNSGLIASHSPVHQRRCRAPRIRR